ncbi:hypothetical protein MASR2M18_00100 [Ignavibacteria bacterium]|nr:DinB family protein [Bacteroidota bacterium]MCZ2131791.1 DinB family protein [Bacteroidota bacterium]
MTNKEFFLSRLATEEKFSTDIIRTCSADSWDYSPHQRNRSAKELIGHFTAHLDDLIEAVEHGVINHRPMLEFAAPEEAARHYEASNKSLIEKIGALGDSEWNDKKVDFMLFGKKLFALTITEHCWHSLFGLIHHRGQLSAYLRPMGAVQTAVYGPTREQTESMHGG